MRRISVWWMMTTQTRFPFQKVRNRLLTRTTDPTHKPCSHLQDLCQGHNQQETHLGHLKTLPKVSRIRGLQAQITLFKTLRDHHNRTKPGLRPMALPRPISQATVALFSHHHRHRVTTQVPQRQWDSSPPVR